MKNLYLHFKTVLFLVLSVGAFCVAEAQESSNINVIDNGVKEFVISKQYIYSNKTVAKSIQDVIATDDFFKIHKKPFLNTGISNRYNWIKIKLNNKSNQSDFIFELNQTYIDSVAFYVVKDNTIIKKFPKKGLHFEHNNNPSYLSNKYAYTYPISIQKDESLEFYIHTVVNDGAFRGMNKIWSKSAYKEREKDIKIRSAYLIFFAGFTVLVVVISIAMFFFSKQLLYLYYAGFVSVIFLNLLGLRYFVSPLYFEKYLFFGNNFLEMFTLLQAFFVMQYLKYFFSLKNYYPKLYLIIERAALLVLSFFVVALFLRQFEWFYMFSYYFAKVLLLLATVGFYTIAIKLCFKKEIMAYYFVIAYFPLMFFVVFYILTALKLTSSYSPLEWEVVIFIEIIVLTIAMSHRYYLLMKENLAYQKKIYNQRLKISRDLHDNIGAQLTFIISSIDNLQYGFKIKNEKLTNKLTSISAFTKETIYELRDTIWAMNKHAISLEDLQARISNFVDKADVSSSSTRFNFNIDESFSKDLKFTSVKGMNIYRIIQESINNSLKYAEASQVNVYIKKTDEHIQFLIEDNGNGFNENEIKYGNGLNNMKKRAKEIGANITIKSDLNIGTSISVILPL